MQIKYLIGEFHLVLQAVSSIESQVQDEAASWDFGVPRRQRQALGLATVRTLCARRKGTVEGGARDWRKCHFAHHGKR